MHACFTKKALFAIACFCLLTTTATAQGVQQLVVEEIEAFPDGGIGNWTVGGKTYVASATTQFVRESPAEEGALAAVVYVARGDKREALLIAPQALKAAEVNDGPYVFWKDDSTAEVITIKNGVVEKTIHENIRAPRVIENLPCVESTLTLDPAPPTIPDSTWPEPEHLLAISDLEGNYANVLAFLKANGIVDADGHWQWGDGALVLVGDLVDRGDQVTELMWLVRRLEREAAKEGGRIHYILGNHEVMVMAGDLRYIHLKYQFVADRLGIPYDQLHGPDTEIGRWWRSKNAIERVGELLFVHAGYSPALDSAELDEDELNGLIRKSLPPAIPSGTTVATNPIAHQDGPLWYRGYFPQHAFEWGGLATTEQIGKILNRHGAKHIVIGHTVVAEVGPLDDSRMVIAIDVDWKDSQKGEGLLWEGGKAWRTNMRGRREPIFTDE